MYVYRWGLNDVFQFCFMTCTFIVMFVRLSRHLLRGDGNNYTFPLNAFLFHSYILSVIVVTAINLSMF